jgi:hypothetical protein
MEKLGKRRAFVFHEIDCGLARNTATRRGRDQSTPAALGHAAPRPHVHPLATPASHQPKSLALVRGAQTFDLNSGVLQLIIVRLRCGFVLLGKGEQSAKPLSHRAGFAHPQPERDLASGA